MMRRMLGFLAVAALALGLGGCCCPMSSGDCKAEGKPMSCDMKKAACSCCDKGAEGTPSQGHQH